MKDGFLKAAALSPALRVADCAYNVRQITEALRKAAARGVKLAVFPEFCLTGYTCGDLFLQRTLQTGAGARQAVQLRRRAVPWQNSGPCAQDLSAQLWRVLRKAPVHPGQHRGGADGGVRSAGALWHLPAVPLPPNAQLCAGCGDLRGSVERPAALHLPRAGRCDRDRKSFRQR